MQSINIPRAEAKYQDSLAAALILTVLINCIWSNMSLVTSLLGGGSGSGSFWITEYKVMHESPAGAGPGLQRLAYSPEPVHGAIILGAGLVADLKQGSHSVHSVSGTQLDSIANLHHEAPARAGSPDVCEPDLAEHSPVFSIQGHA